MEVGRGMKGEGWRRPLLQTLGAWLQQPPLPAPSCRPWPGPSASCSSLVPEGRALIHVETIWSPHHLFSPLLPTCRQSCGFSPRNTAFTAPLPAHSVSQCSCRSPCLHSVPRPCLCHTAPGCRSHLQIRLVSSQDLSIAVAWPGLQRTCTPALPSQIVWNPQVAFQEDATLLHLWAYCVHPPPPRPSLPALTPTRSSSMALPLLCLAGPLGAGTGAGSLLLLRALVTSPLRPTSPGSSSAQAPVPAPAAGQPRALSGFGTGAPDADPVPK